MFERFRKSDRGREQVRPADTEDPATTVRDRDMEPATTVRDRDMEPATTVRDRDEAPAATVAPRGEDSATAVRARDDAPATGVAPAADDPATRLAPAREGPAPSERFDRELLERRTLAPVVGDDTLIAMRERQRIRFGGFSWGSAFFGLLSAIGLASILLAVVAAAGVALGLSEVKDTANGTNDTIGLGGGIVLLCVLAVAWYCGGYVAGRMARFDGVRQGVGVWVWTLAIAAALAIAAVIGGTEYNVLQQLNLPNVAVGDQSLTTGGWLTLAAAVVVTLVFAVLGGKAGDLFHRRVDRFATRDYVETA